MPDSISTTDDNSDTVAFPAGSLPEELPPRATTVGWLHRSAVSDSGTDCCGRNRGLGSVWQVGRF